jgi:prepilin-type processing-associated H-X9-DG protein
MFTRYRSWLVGACAFVALACPAAAAPPSKEVAEILSWVPADTALFFHADVAALWKTKQADAFRKANPEKLYEQLKELADAVGVSPDDVKTFTVFLPKLKGPGDQARVCLAFTLAKPLNAKQTVAGLNALAEIKKIPEEFGFKKFKKVRDGVYAIEERVPPRPTGAANEKPAEEPKTLFLFDNPNRVVILGPRGNDLATPQTGKKDSPIAEALAAAAEGKTAAFGLNFASLPDEIRQENLPPQMEPFKPIIHADAIVGTVTLGDDLAVNVAIKAGTRPKALEAEKSLGVFKTLMQTVLAAGLAEMKKDEGNAKLADLGKTAQAALQSMKFASDDAQATVSLAVKADFDVQPVFALFSRTGQAAARANTVNNLKQLGLAMHNYEGSYQTMPPAAILGKKGKPLLSWRVAILPYIEQDNLYKQFKLDEPWDSDHNKKLLENTPMPRIFEVVGTTKPGSKETHFQVFRGNGAMFDLVQGVKITQIADGTSNTFMVAQAKTAVPWTKPDDIAYDPKKDPYDWFLWVNDGTNVAFGDGSVRTISKKLKPATLHAYITKGGGEIIEE